MINIHFMQKNYNRIHDQKFNHKCWSQLNKFVTIKSVIHAVQLMIC